MSVSIPTISGVSPLVNDSSVELKQKVQVIFGGPSLIESLTWNDNTFALYGPGDVVLDTGPGNILNTGVDDAKYPLLGGALRRDRVPGAFTLYVSGRIASSGMTNVSGYIGDTSSYIIGEFTPSVPLSANTTYTAVVAGNDAATFLTTNRKYAGVTSYVHNSGFALSGVASTSGQITVVDPYSSTLETSIYDSSTGYNDKYIITITSGSTDSYFKYNWTQASSAGTYSATVSGTETHLLRNNLKVNFAGSFALNEVFELPVYIPRPLALSTIWSFSTGDVSEYASPPVTPSPVSIVLDDTADGGLSISSATITSGTRFRAINSDPAHLDYDVSAGLTHIAIEFDQPLLSGIYSLDNVEITSSPLLGISGNAVSSINPTLLQTSGKFLKIWL